MSKSGTGENFGTDLEPYLDKKGEKWSFYDRQMKREIGLILARAYS